MRAVTRTSKRASKAFPSHQSQQDIFSTRWFRKRKLRLEVALRAQHQEFVLKRPAAECYNHQADSQMQTSNTYCSQKPGAAMLAKRLITFGCELEPRTQQSWGFGYSLGKWETLRSPWLRWGKDSVPLFLVFYLCFTQTGMVISFSHSWIQTPRAWCKNKMHSPWLRWSPCTAEALPVC